MLFPLSRLRERVGVRAHWVRGSTPIALTLPSPASGRGERRGVAIQQRRSLLERHTAIAFDLQRQQIIRARAPEIHRSDRLAQTRSRAREAITREHHQRRTDHEHRIGRIEMRRRALHAFTLHVLAEEHDIGFQKVPATRAIVHAERREVEPFKIGIAVGRIERIERQPRRIQRFELVLKRIARHAQIARETAHAIEPPVQIDHVAAAGGLMQPVDVLGQQYFDTSLG